MHFFLPFIPDEYITATFKELEFILPYLFFFALSLHFVAILAGRLSIELSREKILKEDILQNMINGLVVVDKEGKLVFYNPPARAMLQISENPKPIGSSIDRILSGSRYDILREAMLNKKEIHQEIELRDKQGKNVSIEIATSVLTNPKGQLRGVIAVLNDISLKKAMEEVVKRMETLQALSEMSTGIAHEIRNPLASVKSAIQQLAANLKLAGDDKKLMSIIIKESDRLNRIITDFLEFARERPLVIQECNLNELIEEVIVLLGKKDEQKDVAIQAELAGSLTCEGDAEQLKQVFLNLGLNAIESSRDHSRVVIRGYTKDGENNTSGVTVEIIDSGVGIEPANLERIYDPFYTTKPKGVGLGLAIASRIIQRHQGKVFVQSRLRDGTKFSVWLPSRILSEEVKS
ncbi:Signal transduction histidine-protein kinase AtoS [subsurface metagenome]